MQLICYLEQEVTTEQLRTFWHFSIPLADEALTWEAHLEMFGSEHFEGCFPHLSVPGSVFTVAAKCHCKLVYWGLSCAIRDSFLRPISFRTSQSRTLKNPSERGFYQRGGRVELPTFGL